MFDIVKVHEYREISPRRTAKTTAKRKSVGKKDKAPSPPKGNETLEERLAQRRADPAFRKERRDLIEEHGEILDRLAQ